MEIYKNAYVFFEKQKKKTWEKDFSLLELTEKKVCIVGYGSVGRETAKRFSAFGAEIIAVNRSKIEDQVVNRWIPLKKIDEILPEVDIIILCIALTGETMNLINSVRLDKMKDGSVLVNISRGNIIERKALRKFLKKEKFRGVALDVFDEEPLSKDSDLWETPKVLSAHIILMWVIK